MKKPNYIKKFFFWWFFFISIFSNFEFFHPHNFHIQFYCKKPVENYLNIPPANSNKSLSCLLDEFLLNLKSISIKFETIHFNISSFNISFDYIKYSSLEFLFNPKTIRSPPF